MKNKIKEDFIKLTKDINDLYKDKEGLKIRASYEIVNYISFGSKKHIIRLYEDLSEIRYANYLVIEVFQCLGSESLEDIHILLKEETLCESSSLKDVYEIIKTIKERSK